MEEMHKGPRSVQNWRRRVRSVSSSRGVTTTTNEQVRIGAAHPKGRGSRHRGGRHVGSGTALPRKRRRQMQLAAPVLQSGGDVGVQAAAVLDGGVRPLFHALERLENAYASHRHVD